MSRETVRPYINNKEALITCIASQNLLLRGWLGGRLIAVRRRWWRTIWRCGRKMLGLLGLRLMVGGGLPYRQHMSDSRVALSVRNGLPAFGPLLWSKRMSIRCER